MEEPLPTIDSIIHSWNKAKWEKLDQRHEVAKLHERFWHQGAYKDKLLNPPEAEDDEIGSGCFVLDFGIPDIRPTKVWVRNEYLRIYKYCNNFLEAPHEETDAPAVIVTGQPGIGKSCWLRYALCRRLAQKKPTIWYRGHNLLLFVTEGVYMTDSTYGCTEYCTRVWTLVDAEPGEGFSERLKCVGQQDTKNLIIFTSSPNPQRWGRLRDTTFMTRAIMNPWTRAEISAAAPLHGFQADDQRLDEMYNQFGPTARICFHYPRRPVLVTEHQERYSVSLRSISSRILQEIVTGLFSPELRTLSNTMILLKRLPGEEYHRITLEPATPTVEMDLREQLRRETHAQRLELYHHLTNVETSKSLAGVVYESLIQDKFREQATISLDLVPMVRRGWGRHSPWCFNHGGGTSPTSYEISRTLNDTYSAWLSTLYTNVYYSPDSPNQVRHDAFIMDGASRQLFIFQFTIAKSHQIEKGLFDFFSHNSLPPKASWHFVFVVPSTSELNCSYPTSDPSLGALLEEIHLYTVVEDPQPLPLPQLALVSQPVPVPQPPADLN
ncbi:hypothetical protein EI94DRAFT_1831410 [Lactarius quietus]|nr:hypothetical protein EI94DRAFT_1831410 [Lactarius quietus]